MACHLLDYKVFSTPNTFEACYAVVVRSCAYYLQVTHGRVDVLHSKFQFTTPRLIVYDIMHAQKLIWCR